MKPVPLELALNTNRSKKCVLVWKGGSRPAATLAELLKQAKQRLGTRKKVTRLFLLATGEELTKTSNFEGLLVPSTAILASFGEDFTGTLSAPVNLDTSPFYDLGSPYIDVERAVAEESLRIGLSFIPADLSSQITGSLVGQIVGFLVAPTVGESLSVDVDQQVQNEEEEEEEENEFDYATAVEPQPKPNKETAQETRDNWTRRQYDQCLELCRKARQHPVFSKRYPKGLGLADFSIYPSLLSSAQQELRTVFQAIGTELKRSHPTLLNSTTNLRFAINTPYFSRKSSEPWPVLQWGDHRIRAVCDLIALTVLAFKGDSHLVPSPLLNVVVRGYRVDDVLGFHTDRGEFGDDVFGIVIDNKIPERGLMLRRQTCIPYAACEKPGTAWCLRESSRLEWEHGYSAPKETDTSTTSSSTSTSPSTSTTSSSTSTSPSTSTTSPSTSTSTRTMEVLRSSVSFRFFKSETMIPTYSAKHVLKV